MNDLSITKDQMKKVAEEEIPIIATLLGDETQKVELTIDEMISKAVSQQAEASMSDVKKEMVSLSKMIVEPPYDPLKLALMLEINTRLMRSCHLRARNTVGLGWIIRPVPRDEDEDVIDEKKYRAQKKQLKKLYTNPNPRAVSLMLPETLATPLDFAEIMNRMKIDEEATGNGYLEITRNNTGQIDGIYNIPSHTIRVLRRGGYIQVRGRWAGSDLAFHADVKTQRCYFKRFGDMRPVSRVTGQEESNISPEERATEILSFHIYSSRSSWYGIPRWISAVAAIQGSRLASIRNMAFFENDAVGRMAIVVSGGALTSQSVQDLRTFVNREGKGVENAHRVMVLQAEPRKVISSKGAGTKIDLVPLTVGIDEDASFLGYRAANDEEVREASGLSSPFFTAAGVNRGSANVLRKITIEQDLIPDLNSHEHIINRTLSYDYLTSQMSDGAKANFNMSAELKLKEPASVDELEQAQIQGQYARNGIVTINEARRFLGLTALPDDLVYGQLPLPMALAYFEGGLFRQGAITDDGVEDYDETQKRLLAEMKKAADVAEGAKAKASIKIDDARAKNSAKAAESEQKAVDAVADAVVVANGEAEAGKAAAGTAAAKATAPEKWHSKKHIGQLREMSGIAWRLKQYLKSQGRDMSGELILQGRNGDILDRIDLDDLKEGFDE